MDNALSAKAQWFFPGQNQSHREIRSEFPIEDVMIRDKEGRVLSLTDHLTLVLNGKVPPDPECGVPLYHRAGHGAGAYIRTATKRELYALALSRGRFVCSR